MSRALTCSMLFIFSALTFISCSKSDDSDNNNYIKGKIDGEAFNFSAYASAKIVDFGSGMSSVAFIANKSSSTGTDGGLMFTINFFGGSQLETGEYSQDYAGADYTAGGVYTLNSATIIWGAGIYYPTVLPLKINIISISDKEISGTFEGAFYKQDSSIPAFYDEHKLITEGEFKLRIE